MSNLVSLEYLNDYGIDELRKAINNGLQLLGVKNKFKPNMKVLIKACLPFASSKDDGLTTHPAFIRGIVDCFNDMGVKCIIADSPENKFTEDHLSLVYFNTGMLEMANMTACELNTSLKTIEIEVPEGKRTKGIRVLEVINQVDAIINVGKLKFDNDWGYLGASTNLFGLIPGEMKSVIRNRLNNLDEFNDYIIDLHETLKNKIVLNILDAVVAIEANSTQRMLNCVAMSENAYSLDAAMFSVLDVKYENTILKQAQNRELFDFKKPYKLVGDKIEKFKLTDFSLVDFDNHTEIKQPKGYFKSHQQRPCIDNKVCKGCKICSRICPTNAIMMKYDKNGELYAEIDYKKCIFCNKCITACPYSVVKQKTPLAYKSMMKEIEKHNVEEN